jgi:hypothetical protein
MVSILIGIMLEKIVLQDISKGSILKNPDVLLKTAIFASGKKIALN